jgi:hypothetical protein
VDVRVVRTRKVVHGPSTTFRDVDSLADWLIAGTQWKDVAPRE